MSCKKCNKKVNRFDGIICAACGNKFHCMCIGLEKDNVTLLKNNRANWFCFQCEKNDNCISNNSSFIDNDNDNLDSTNTIHIVSTPTLVSHTNTSNITLETLYNKLVSLENSNKTMSDKLCLLENAMKKILELEQENLSLKKIIKEQNNKIENLDNLSHQNCIVISGVPINTEVNICDTVNKIICDGIGISCNSSDIDYCYQKKNYYDKETCNIFVKFLSRFKKDSIMKKIRADKIKLNSSFLISNSNKKIFVNESMPYHMRVIYKKARDLKKVFQFKFLWYRNSKLYIKKDINSEVYIIRNEIDLEHISNKF